MVSYYFQRLALPTMILLTAAQVVIVILAVTEDSDAWTRTLVPLYCSIAMCITIACMDRQYDWPVPVWSLVSHARAVQRLRTIGCRLGVEASAAIVHDPDTLRSYEVRQRGGGDLHIVVKTMTDLVSSRYQVSHTGAPVVTYVPSDVVGTPLQNELKKTHRRPLSERNASATELNDLADSLERAINHAL